MAEILEGIDLQGLIDLETEFGTALGGPAGPTRWHGPKISFRRPGHGTTSKRKKGLARKRAARASARRRT